MGVTGVAHRAASRVPATAAAKVLGIDGFTSDDAERRFATLVHWAHGTGWGCSAGQSPLVAAAGLVLFILAVSSDAAFKRYVRLGQ